MRPILGLLLAGIACTPTTTDPGDDGTGGGDTGTSSDTGGSDTGDTGDTGSTDTREYGGDGFLTKVWAEPHEELESIVLVEWTQADTASTWVEYAFVHPDGGDPETFLTPAVDRDAGDHVQPLMGIPYGHDVTWSLHYDAGDGEKVAADGELATPALPDAFPVPELIHADDAAWEPTGHYLLGSVNQRAGGWMGGNFWKFVMDRQGRIVWLHKTPQEHWSIFLRISADETHIVWDEATYWADFDDGAGSRIHRWYLDGTVIEELDAPGLHHAFTELPDGTLVWGQAHDPDEKLVSLAPGSDTVETLWTCLPWMRAAGSRDSCQSNTLYYSPERDSFLFSFYTSDTLVEIDRATGTEVWWAGMVPGGYTFDPPDSQFAWQHGTMWTEDGNLLLSTKDTAFGWPDETLAREYVVDHEAETLTNTWTYGEGEGVLGDTAGEAHRLPNGNTLHNYGSAAHLKEVTPDGDVVWEVAWASERLLGRTVFIEDLYTLLPPTE